MSINEKYEINVNFNKQSVTGAKKTSPQIFFDKEKPTAVSSREKERSSRGKMAKKASFMAVGASIKLGDVYIATQGLRTGDYTKQREQEVAMSNIKRVASVAGAFAINPLAGAGVLAYQVIDLEVTAYKRRLEISNENNIAEEKRHLQGLTYNNSRYKGRS